MADGPGWSAVALDDVEAVPWRDTRLTWRPLRHALGTRIAGMSAYTAERAGEPLIEPHTESGDGRGHEEVYVVLRGRATFTLDGADVDAPACTFVVVSDPAVHRQARAAEPHTAVIALGGPRVFDPAASEWIERARPHIRVDPHRAERIVAELRAERPGSPGTAIGTALLAVGRGDLVAARRALADVLARWPGLREQLASDPDLAVLLEE
jgi:hypothetical protein